MRLLSDMWICRWSPEIRQLNSAKNHKNYPTTGDIMWRLESGSSSPPFNETFTVNRLTFIDDKRDKHWMHSHKLPFIRHEAKRCKTNTATIIITKCYLYHFGRLIRGIWAENAHDSGNSGSIWQISADKCLALEMRSVRIAHKRETYANRCERKSVKENAEKVVPIFRMNEFRVCVCSVCIIGMCLARSMASTQRPCKRHHRVIHIYIYEPIDTFSFAFVRCDFSGTLLSSIHFCRLGFRFGFIFG